LTIPSNLGLHGLEEVTADQKKPSKAYTSFKAVLFEKPPIKKIFPPKVVEKAELRALHGGFSSSENILAAHSRLKSRIRSEVDFDADMLSNLNLKPGEPAT
jgi:hypothetical protein